MTLKPPAILSAEALTPNPAASFYERLTIQVRKFERTLKAGEVVTLTPAMEAGIADHVWSIEEIVGLLV
jgi:hypothetical protein